MDSEKPDLGVLFVHGIGEQVQGETLVHFADPLSSWIVRWLSRGALTEPGIGRSGDEGPVLLSGSNLRPNDDGPARTLMTVRAEGHEQLGGRTEWLLAESWWAETFRPPKTTTVLLWVLVVLPYLLLEQFYVPLARSLRIWKQRKSQVAAVRIAIFFVLFVVSLPIAALGELLVLLLLVPLLIPIPRLHNFAKSVAVKLANSLGDSFVLTSSTVQFDAMVRQVAHDLAWLESEAKAVAVVAHSQGTAVAHEAIRRYGKTENLSFFATVGQGVAKLHRVRALRRTHKNAGFAFAWLGLVGLSFLASLTPRVLVSFARHDVPPVATALWVCGMVAVAVPYVLFRRFMRDAVREEQDLLLPPGSRPAQWVNYYASADPVSNGPLFDSSQEAVQEVEVWNGASVLTDHTQYAKSQDDFLASLAMNLFATIGGVTPPPQTIAALTRARWRGWWRVWWLSAARLTAFAAGIVVVYGVWRDLSPIGQRVTNDTPHFVRTSVQSFTKPLRHLFLIGDSRTHLLVGIATVAAVLSAAFVVITLVWRYWEAKDVERFFRRRDTYAETSPVGGTQFGWLVGSLMLLIGVALFTGVTRDYAAGWNFGRGHWVWSLAIVASLGLAPLLVDSALRSRAVQVENTLMTRFPRDPAEFEGDVVEAGGETLPPSHVSAG